MPLLYLLNFLEKMNSNLYILIHLALAANYFASYYRSCIIYEAQLIKMGRGIQGVPNWSAHITVLNTVFNCGYHFCVALIFWSSGSNNSKNYKPPTILSKIYYNIVVPISTVVVVMYWAIFFLDSDQLFDPEYASVFPIWHTIIIHCSQIVTLVVESLFTNHTSAMKNFSLFRYMLLQLIIILAFIKWSQKIYFKAGIWNYEIMRVFWETEFPENLKIRTILPGSACLLTYFGLQICSYLNYRTFVCSGKKRN